MKKKIILTSLLTMMLCASLIVGATMALFTSKSEVNIAVTSGKVNVQAGIKLVATSSLGEPTELGTFQNGGSAYVSDEAGNEGALVLNNITPGDSAVVKVTMHNASEIAIQYRICVEKSGELANALEVSGVTDGIGAWKRLAPKEEFPQTEVQVTISFPDRDDNNLYAGKSGSVLISVEAVQGNADTSGAIAGVETEAFTDAAGYVSKAQEMMDAGITFTSEEYKGGTALVAKGEIAVNSVLDNAVDTTTTYGNAYTVFVAFRVKNPDADLYTKAYITANIPPEPNTEVQLEEGTGDYVDVYNMLYGDRDTENGGYIWYGMDRVRTMKIVWADESGANTLSQTIAFDATGVTIGHAVVDTTEDFVEALNDTRIDTIELAAGTYDLSNVVMAGNYGLRITRPVTIFGAGDTTVLKFGNNGSAISGQAEILVASGDVTIKDMALVAGHVNDGNVSVIKVNNGNNTVPVNVRLENLYITAGAGHAINVHPGENVVIDGCYLEDYAKCGIAIANSKNVTISNTVFTVESCYGDIGLMYGPGDPVYENPSSLILGEGNQFAMNWIYSERFATAPGGKDTVEGVENYPNMMLVESEYGWAIMMPAATIGDAKYATVQSAIDDAQDGDVIRIAKGTFYEALNVQGKSVTLQGAGKDLTTICGPKTYSVDQFPSQKWVGWNDNNGVNDATVYAIISANKDVTIKDLTVSGIPEQIYAVTDFKDQPASAFVGIHIQSADAVLENVDIENIKPSRVTGNDHHNFGLYITSAENDDQKYLLTYTNGTVSDVNRGAIYCWSSNYTLKFKDVTVYGPGTAENPNGTITPVDPDAANVDLLYAFAPFYLSGSNAATTYQNVFVYDSYRVEWGGADWNGWASNDWATNPPEGVTCENCGIVR